MKALAFNTLKAIDINKARIGAWNDATQVFSDEPFYSTY
jgi:hypothetical protein